MSFDAAIDDWDEEFLGAAVDCVEKLEASRKSTQNPNPPPPPPQIPRPSASIATAFTSVGFRGIEVFEVSSGSATLQYSPPRELSQRVPDRIEPSQSLRAPSAPVPKNGGYWGSGTGKNKRDREIERLKSELERASKQLSVKERECKELQRDRDKKDEQLKDVQLHIVNKDAEISRLKSTNLSYVQPAKDVQMNGKSANLVLKDGVGADNGSLSYCGPTIPDRLYLEKAAQSKRTKTKGVQTDIVQDVGTGNFNNAVPIENILSSKLHAIWGFPRDKLLGRNIISKLFQTCSADFCALFECMNLTSKTSLYSCPNNGISDTTLHEGLKCPSSVDAVKVSQLYEIIMKVHHEIAPLQTLLEALFDVCTLENVVAAHKSLCILHAILQHLSCSTKVDGSVLCSGKTFWSTNIEIATFPRVEVLV